MRRMEGRRVGRRVGGRERTADKVITAGVDRRVTAKLFALEVKVSHEMGGKTKNYKKRNVCSGTLDGYLSVCLSVCLYVCLSVLMFVC